MTAEERNRKPLTLDDAKAILAECPHVKNVTVESCRASTRTSAASLRSGALRHHEITDLDYTGTDSVVSGRL